MPKTRRFRLLGGFLVLALAVGLGALYVHPTRAYAATNQIKGVNWADSAGQLRQRCALPVRAQLVRHLLLRLPPWRLRSSASCTRSPAPTRSACRSTSRPSQTTGAPTPARSTTALTKGNVILAYWAYTGGKPPNTRRSRRCGTRSSRSTAATPNAYFEVINEPYGYSTTDLDNLYNTWLTRYPTVPRGRVILDGAGLATNVSGGR